MKINTLINNLSSPRFSSLDAQKVLDYLLTIEKTDPDYLKYFELTYALLMFKKKFSKLELWLSGVTFYDTRFFYLPENKRTYEFNGKTLYFIAD